jgi:hypothetical protein
MFCHYLKGSPDDHSAGYIWSIDPAWQPTAGVRWWANRRSLVRSGLQFYNIDKCRHFALSTICHASFFLFLQIRHFIVRHVGILQLIFWQKNVAPVYAIVSSLTAAWGVVGSKPPPFLNEHLCFTKLIITICHLLHFWREDDRLRVVSAIGFMNYVLNLKIRRYIFWELIVPFNTRTCLTKFWTKFYPFQSYDRQRCKTL